MKPKKFRLVPLVLIALVICVAIWLFLCTPEYTATATLRVIPAAKTDAPRAVTPVITYIESPKLPPTTVNGGATASLTEADTLARAELKSTNQDIARMMREQGVPAAEIAYAPPDPLTGLRPTQEFAIDRTPNPQEIQSRENEAQIYDNLATLTPTINATGDKAIYYDKANSDGNPQRLAIFLRIDGKWYLQLDWSRE